MLMGIRHRCNAGKYAGWNFAAIHREFYSAAGHRAESFVGASCLKRQSSQDAKRQVQARRSPDVASNPSLFGREESKLVVREGSSCLLVEQHVYISRTAVDLEVAYNHVGPAVMI